MRGIIAQAVGLHKELDARRPSFWTVPTLVQDTRAQSEAGVNGSVGAIRLSFVEILAALMA